MGWFSKARNKVKETAVSVKDTAIKHIVATGLIMGGAVAAGAFFGLHLINWTIIGNLFLSSIAGLFASFIALTSSAFLPIASALGAIAALIVIVLVKNARIRELEENKASSEQLIQQQAEEIKKLKDDRKTADKILNSKEITGVTENATLRNDIDTMKKDLEGLSKKQIEEALANKEQIDSILQKTKLHEEEIKELKRMMLLFSVAAGAGAAGAGAAAGSGAAANDAPAKSEQGVTQRRADKFK